MFLSWCYLQTGPRQPIVATSCQLANTHSHSHTRRPRDQSSRADVQQFSLDDLMDSPSIPRVPSRRCRHWTLAHFRRFAEIRFGSSDTHARSCCDQSELPTTARRTEAIRNTRNDAEFIAEIYVCL